MFRVEAINITQDGQRPDGTCDYRAIVSVNHKEIWCGRIEGHVRERGAAELLRLIAAKMEEQK